MAPASSGVPADRRRAFLVAGGVLVVALVVALVILIPRLGDDSEAAKSSSVATPGATVTASALVPGAFAEGAGAPGPLTVLAHRGNFEKYPHETLPGLVVAAEAGQAVETDVHWTADNVPILIHEDTGGTAANASEDKPLGCSGGPYVIAKTKWSVLKARCRTVPAMSKDGTRYPIATLDEAMKAIAAVPGAWAFVEVKNEKQTLAQTALFLTIIEKYGMAKRTVVTSFFPQALVRVRAQAEADGITLKLMRFLPGPAGPELPPVSELDVSHLYAVAVRADVITAAYVTALKAKNLVVIDWTPNTKAQWAAAKTAGATTVLTDQPDSYRKWVK